MLIELIEDKILFRLDDLVQVSAIAESERGRWKDEFNTRLTLKGRQSDLLLMSTYEEVRNAITHVARALQGHHDTGIVPRQRTGEMGSE